MARDPEVHAHLYLSEQGGTLSGRVCPDGGSEQTFTGWIGLNAAIDELIRAGQSAEAPLEPAAALGDESAGASGGPETR